VCVSVRASGTGQREVVQLSQIRTGRFGGSAIMAAAQKWAVGTRVVLRGRVASLRPGADRARHSTWKSGQSKICVDRATAALF
jgi:hypothetical protein